MGSWIPRLARTRRADAAPRSYHPPAGQDEPRLASRAAQYVAELTGTRTAAGRLAYELRVVCRDPGPAGTDDALTSARVLFGPVTVQGDPGVAMCLAQVLLAREGWCACDFWTPDPADWVYRAEVHTIEGGRGLMERSQAEFHADIYWAGRGTWLAEVVSSVTCLRVAGPYRLEHLWRSDQQDAAKSEACKELPAHGWDVTSGFRWRHAEQRFEANVRQRACTPLCDDVPVSDLRAGDVVVLGILGGMIELIRHMGTECGTVRWRYVHRDAKALGRRGTTNMQPDGTVVVLARGPGPGT